MVLRKTIALTSLLIGLTSGAGVFANETGTVLSNDYEVLLVEGRFFPETTYLKPGDRIIFVNMTDSDASAAAADDSWSTGTLGVDGTYTLEITPEIHTTFNLASAASAATDATDAEGTPGIGYISFDPAPFN